MLEVLADIEDSDASIDVNESVDAIAGSDRGVIRIAFGLLDHIGPLRPALRTPFQARPRTAAGGRPGCQQVGRESCERGAVMGGSGEDMGWPARHSRRNGRTS